MATILVIGPEIQSLINFRGDLLTAMQARGHRVLAVAPDGDEAAKNKLLAMGVTFLPIPMVRARMSVLADLTTFWALKRILKVHRPDCVLAYTIKPVIYGMLAARWAGISRRFALITGRGYVFTSLSSSLKSRLVRNLILTLYRMALRGVAGAIFQNPDDRAFFQELSMVDVSVPKYLVNGSGVNLARFSPAPLPASPIFLMIARLLRDKGVCEYAKAARRLKATHPQAVCRLAGPLDVNPSVISEKELRGWIDEGILDYLGVLEDVRPAIAAASVFVLPSYREGTPRSVLEAMAMGRAILTTDVPGCRETVRQEYNGLLVPAYDEEALAQAMGLMADNSASREEMGNNSLHLVQEKYDVHKVNQRMLEILGL